MDNSFGAVAYTYHAGTRLYLLVLHASGAHWDFPKGHPLPSEEPQATILREVREETGCDIQLLPDYADSISFILPMGGAKQISFRLGRLARPDCIALPNDEIRGIGWFTFAEACQTITYANSREVLIRAHAFLERHGPSFA
jgi:8-oxo-dGTP pyrophosphatase MutT (NUDIX family)